MINAIPGRPDVRYFAETDQTRCKHEDTQGKLPVSVMTSELSIKTGTIPP